MQVIGIRRFSELDNYVLQLFAFRCTIYHKLGQVTKNISGTTNLRCKYVSLLSVLLGIVLRLIVEFIASIILSFKVT